MQRIHNSFCVILFLMTAVPAAADIAEVRQLQAGETYIVLPTNRIPQNYIEALHDFAAERPDVKQVYSGQILWKDESKASKVIAVKMDGDLRDILPDLALLTKKALPDGSAVDFVQVKPRGVITEKDLPVMSLIYTR